MNQSITPLDFMPPQSKCERCGGWFEEFTFTDIDHPWLEWTERELEDHNCDKYLVKNIMTS
jgi:hypothetical protein